MKKLLLIDNYDSFSYNLQYAFASLGAEVSVYRNDIARADLDAFIASHDGVIISPGPGNPSQAGHCLDIIRDHHQTTPILGICLGHQAIIEALGGTITHAESIVHGKTAILNSQQRGLFATLPSGMQVARYHSLQGAYDDLPAVLQVDATIANNTAENNTVESSTIVMAVSHKEYPTFGLQFHPESIMTRHGDRLLESFLNYL